MTATIRVHKLYFNGLNCRKQRCEVFLFYLCILFYFFLKRSHVTSLRVSPSTCRARSRCPSRVVASKTNEERCFWQPVRIHFVWKVRTLLCRLPLKPVLLGWTSLPAFRIHPFYPSVRQRIQTKVRCILLMFYICLNELLWMSWA